jgi:outer membrane protein TolC
VTTATRPLALLVLAAGCAVGPTYERPPAPVPVAFKEASPGWKTAEPLDTATRGPWWKLFRDAKLDELEALVDVDNQSLRVAAAQLAQARALVGVARADYYPTLTTSPGAGVTQNRVSQHRALFIPGAKINYTDIIIPADVSYEVDVWGRVRRSVESALDVAQAETQLEVTRAQAIDVRVTRAQTEHAIAVLIGRPPSSFALAAVTAPLEPPVIPGTGLPTELLERRPDVAAAERRMASANARIGVAQAAYFPALRLDASGGVQSAMLSNLFSVPSLFFAVGASAMATIFDGGRRRALTDQARAGYDEVVASYRGTVLGALQEVEDALAALRILEQEATAQAAAVAAADSAVTLSTNRYKGGVVTYLEVIVAQSAALNAKRTAVDIQRRRLLASVLLIKALGGGWRS